MNILFICNRFMSGRDIVKEDFGYVIRFSEELAKLDHEVTLYAGNFHNKEHFVGQHKNLKIISFPFNRISLPFYLFRIISHIVNQKYDIIIVDREPLYSWAAYIATRLSRSPMIYYLGDIWSHENWIINKFYDALVNFLIKRVDGCACISPALLEKVKELGCKAGAIVSTGIDLKAFTKQNPHKSRERLNLPSDKRIIAYTGSISKNRGIEILVEAAAIVRRSLPDVELYLFGKSAPNYAAGLKYGQLKISDLKPEKVVYAISSADALVLPNPVSEFSKYCFPYKLLEYLACDQPVVATDIGIASTLLSSHRELLCSPGNAKDMAEKIINVLNSQDNRSGLRSIVLEYSWQNSAAHLNELILNITEKQYQS